MEDLSYLIILKNNILFRASYEDDENNIENPMWFSDLDGASGYSINLYSKLKKFEKFLTFLEMNVMRDENYFRRSQEEYFRFKENLTINIYIVKENFKLLNLDNLDNIRILSNLKDKHGNLVFPLEKNNISIEQKKFYDSLNPKEGFTSILKSVWIESKNGKEKIVRGLDPQIDNKNSKIICSKIKEASGWISLHSNIVNEIMICIPKNYVKLSLIFNIFDFIKAIENEDFEVIKSKIINRVNKLLYKKS
uniref:Uncharacterized protein n=1 Tax=Pithovirus LCPAC104 TaxID=2506589 RepID=A0A481Z439_9VIRU|nr:MAG: hypothetical protein LCPAC104_01200 [Pithovirus LCPAC104]